MGVGVGGLRASHGGPTERDGRGEEGTGIV